MDKDSKDFEVFRIRSVGASIRDGYRLYLDNFRRIFRSTWLMALLYALVSGMASTVMVKLVPEYVFTNTAALHDAHLRNAYLIAGIYIVLMLAGGMLHAVGFSLLKGHQQTGSVPVVKGWWGYYHWRTIGRTMISCLVLLLLAVAYVPAFATLVGFLSKHLSMIALGISIFVIVVLSVLMIPPIMMYLLRYILADAAAKSGRPNLPLRYWGGSIMVALVVVIVTVLLSLVTELPSNILTMANIQSQTGALRGDAVGMPEYMQWMNIIAFTLAGFIKAYVSLSAIFPFYYLYGSIEAQENERASLARQFKEF